MTKNLAENLILYFIFITVHLYSRLTVFSLLIFLHIREKNIQVPFYPERRNFGIFIHLICFLYYLYLLSDILIII
jgi:hypothetical protein